MRRLMALLALALVVVSCKPEEDTTGSLSKCATELFASYNPKILDQCVRVCKTCDHGTMTTCTTSCTLKGAR